MKFQIGDLVRINYRDGLAVLFGDQDHEGIIISFDDTRTNKFTLWDLIDERHRYIHEDNLELLYRK